MEALPEKADTRLDALLVGLVALGVLLTVLNRPGALFKIAGFDLFVLWAFPTTIAVTAYVRFARRYKWFEIAALGLWGLASLVVMTFLAGLASMSSPPADTGPGADLIRDLALFGGNVVALTVPYAAAGKLRRRSPVSAAVCAFLAVVALFVVTAFVTAGL